MHQHPVVLCGRGEAVKEGRQILEFVQERNRSTPPLVPGESASIERYVAYSADTVDLYHARFGGKALSLLEDFKRRGSADEKLLAYARHPTNPLGMREVGQELSKLGYELAAK